MDGFNEQKLYDVYWEKYFPVTSSYARHKFAKMCVKEMFAGTINFKSVLDVGCGSAGALEIFNSAGCQSLGLEYSRYLYNTYLKGRFNVVWGDASDMPFPDNEFDLVYSADVLEHLSEARAIKAVSEIYRVTKRYFYGTINNKIDHHGIFHLTVRPWEWWDQHFRKLGFVPIKVKQADVRVFCYEKPQGKKQ